MDGLLRIYNFEEWKDLMNEDFTPFLPADLKFDNEDHRQKVAQQIKEFYFGDRLVSGDTVQEYIDFNSDAMFVVAMHRSVTLQVESGNNNIYLHVFSFTDNNTALIPYSNTRGADHCAQTEVVFDSRNENKITSEYQEISNTMRDLWINFIYTGNPTPEGQTPASVPVWEPAGKDRSPIMHFDKTIEMTGPYEEERQKFWDDIYDKYHRAPVAPYDF